jgi:superfamily I DNA/RNA helicase
VLDQALRTTTVAPGDPLIMFVDEGQDLSAHQIELVKHWGARCLTVVFVCDPDQNLYEWAGTDPGAVWSLPVPEENITVLAQSYRVPRMVHDWAVWWINQTPNRRPVEYYPTDVEGAVNFMPATIDQPGAVLDLVEAWVNDPEVLGKAVKGDVPNAVPAAMLLTTCGYMLTVILDELRSRGIKYFNPYRIKRGDWQWPSTASTRRLARYMWCVLTPEGTEPAPLTIEDVWAWAQLLEASAFAARGVKSMLEDLHREEATRYDVVSFEDLIGWFGEEGAFKAYGGDLDWLEAHILNSKAKSMAGAISIARQRGPQALTAAPQVVVGTYYSVKGGVAQNVVLFPDLSPSAEREAATEAGEAAIRRLVYVGATRPTNGLYLAARATSKAIQWGDWVPLEERIEDT